jgi:hypothetical protein
VLLLGAGSGAVSMARMDRIWSRWFCTMSRSAPLWS